MSKYLLQMKHHDTAKGSVSITETAASGCSAQRGHLSWHANECFRMQGEGELVHIIRGKIFQKGLLGFPGVLALLDESHFALCPQEDVH